MSVKQVPRIGVTTSCHAYRIDDGAVPANEFRICRLGAERGPRDIVTNMSLYSSVGDSGPILAVAKEWADRCWIGDGSILFPGEEVWTLANVEALYEAFVMNPLGDKRGFLDKLKEQIATAQPNTVKLAAEMLWLLLAWELDMLADTKSSRITEVLSWCKASVGLDRPAMTVLRHGIARPGQRYRQERPSELKFFIEVARRWKPLSTSEREGLLHPWEFAEWLDQTQTDEPRALRHVLLFFLFPDDFEAVSSGQQKQAIRAAFIGEPDVEKYLEAIVSLAPTRSAAVRLDQEILAIRRALENKWGRQFSFYEATVESLWRDGRPATPLPPNPTAPSQAATGSKPELFLGDEEFHRICDELRTFKNIILQGPPGVGKTFIAREVARSLAAGEPERMQLCVFHPSYSYEEFVEGIRPNAQGSFSVQKGTLRIFAEKADSAAKDQSFVLILDEMNRGNASRIFGECLLLLEKDKRGEEWQVPLLYSRYPFYLPPNLLVLGLMNTADRSLAFLDYAFRRRFRFVDLEPQFQTEAFRQHLQSAGVEPAVIGKIASRLPELNSRIRTHLGEGFAVGHSFFCPLGLGSYGEEWYQAIIRREIAPLLREYWHSDRSRAEEAIAALSA